MSACLLQFPRFAAVRCVGYSSILSYSPTILRIGEMPLDIAAEDLLGLVGLVEEEEIHMVGPETFQRCLDLPGDVIEVGVSDDHLEFLNAA